MSEQANGCRAPGQAARRKRTSRTAAFVIVCSLALLGVQADAQDRATERAKLHNAEARKLFNLHKFKEAAEEYEKAYQARPLPIFLYNLAQCHARIPGPESKRKAVHFFESYLRDEESMEFTHSICPTCRDELYPSRK